MSGLTVQEMELVNKKDLREKCIERVEVLDKVKELFLIPELDLMTVKQVADYYEVDVDAVRRCYQRNRSEIDEDGTSVKPYRDFLIGQNVQLETSKGKVSIQCSENLILEIPNRGMRCFSKRAVLRIGMLLRDSPIAREVRTQLLNAFEKTDCRQKTEDIDAETNFVNEIGKAYMSGDISRFAMATQQYIAFQNRHIEKIQKDNKILAGQILEWTDRASLNKAVRILSGKSNQPFSGTFNKLYDELRYRYGIGLSQRGGKPLIQHIREDEWDKVIQSFSAICETNGCSPSEILEKAKL